MLKYQNEVFISYARGGESEKIVDELEEALQTKELTVTRDKRDLAFKGMVTEFMKKIGAGKAVVVVISDRYLKSAYCMFELMEIYRNHDFPDRIFPILLRDVKIDDYNSILKYSRYWQKKTNKLEIEISKSPEVSSVVFDEYELSRKVFNNFKDVMSELKDINALSAEMHRESNFQQISQALLKRLAEGFRYTRQNDTRKLLNELSARSWQYYEELTGVNGTYHHLNISEAILAGISQPADDPIAPRLDTNVKNKKGYELLLESCLQELWQQEKRHMILLGDGGMGKTVSLFHCWKALLESNLKNGKDSIPLFLSLHEYNMASEGKRDGFIAKRIVWHYLGIREHSDEMVDALWEIFKTVPEKEMPSIVLLLDGFDELTVDTSESKHLILELNELRQKGKAVQMVVSSRSEMNFTWVEGFQFLELQPLHVQKIKMYLQEQKLNYPSDRSLQQILQNPMMLTLYANANETVERYKDDNQFDFKPYTTTQGELIWNYLEAHIVKLDRICGRHSGTFYYYKFMIRHFLPYLGFEMERVGQNLFYENKFSGIVNEACSIFYQKGFIEAWPDYRSWLPGFNLEKLNFAKKGVRFEKIANTLCSELRLMRREKAIYEFPHQNFRDYFAAAHLINILRGELQNQKIPLLLKYRPLPVYIRRFAGEIAGEPYQTESPCAGPTVFMQTLDILRGVFDEEKTGYIVSNIVNIFKDTRRHLGEVNLSRLNLLKTGLQKAVCYKRNGSKYKSASFDKSLVNEKYFMPQGHSGNVLSVSFHPDGKTCISGSSDKTIKHWDLQTGACLATFAGHEGDVYSVCFHPDGNSFISGSEDQTIKEWDLQTGKCRATLEGHTSSVLSVSFHPNRLIFISASWDKTVKAWDLKTGACQATFGGEERHDDSASSVVFHPEGRTFVSGSWDQTIKAWDLKTGVCLRTFKGHRGYVNSVSFHPDGGTFISGSEDKTIKAWDLKTGKCLNTFEGHRADVNSVHFHPDGNTFISGSSDQTIKVWDLKTRACLATFEGHSSSVSSVAFHSDGTAFISGSWDKAINSWDLRAGACLATFGGSSSVLSVSFHPGGTTFISASWDKAIKAWDLKTGACLATFEGHSRSVSSVAFHPDGKTFISGSSDKTIKAWDLKTGACLTTFEGHSSSVSIVVFHPNRRTFISGSSDLTIKAWDLKTEACLASFKGHSSSVLSVSFHPDGQIFISGSKDKTIKAWDLNTGACLSTFEGHRGDVNCLSFHPDGETFISGSSDQTIKAWDLKTKACLATFEGHLGPVSSISLFGKTFISGSEDHSIKEWDLKTATCLATFSGHSSSVYCVSFHPDGKTFISGSEDHSIKAWDVKTGACLLTMKNIDGLQVAGCTFMNLHPESQISIEAENIMRQYGAIFDTEDMKQWNETVQRVFGNE